MGAVLSILARGVCSFLPCWWVSCRGAFCSPFLLFLFPLNGLCFLPSCFVVVFFTLIVVVTCPFVTCVLRWAGFGSRIF